MVDLDKVNALPALKVEALGAWCGERAATLEEPLARLMALLWVRMHLKARLRLALLLTTPMAFATLSVSTSTIS
jgi:hypothetical protein